MRFRYPVSRVTMYHRSVCLPAMALGSMIAAGVYFSVAPYAMAQTGGEGAIQGTVTDTSGAVVGNATVTALDAATGVKTTRTTSSDGLYQIDPIIPGHYIVTVMAPGFETTRQENVDIQAMKVTGLNLSLKAGGENTTVAVSAAPPALETTNATLGGVMENETYQALPLSMGGQQRDPTAFAALTPGVQPGSREGVFSGTGNYLSEIYLDGIPLTEASQQGDNRSVSLTVSVDAVDQFQVQTSGIPSEYQGAGLENYVIKSGTNKYHGSAFTFVRNTIFDTWGFTAPAFTQETTSGQVVPASKPAEHQEEWDGTVGGPILKDKLFFFGAYDGFHYTAGVRPSLLTVPTTQERGGDFSQLLTANGGPGIAIYDPTSEANCTAHSTTGACRYQYG